MRPYIGITGFMSAEEVSYVRFHTGDLHGRDLMVGVLASSKTLAGQPNRWPGRFPPIAKIRYIFPPREEGVLNLVHYSTDEPASLQQQLQELRDVAGPHCHGFQLNVTWPDPCQLQLADRSVRFVLQIGKAAIAQEQNSPVRVAKRIFNEYEGLIHYVLFDMSGGYGVPIDLPFAMKFVRALVDYTPLMGIGVAGGLSSTTVHQVAPIMQYYPQLSIDAEGGLRTHKDALDVVEASAYVSQSLYQFAAARR